MESNYNDTILIQHAYHRRPLKMAEAVMMEG